MAKNEIEYYEKIRLKILKEETLKEFLKWDKEIAFSNTMLSLHAKLNVFKSVINRIENKAQTEFRYIRKIKQNQEGD